MMNNTVDLYSGQTLSQDGVAFRVSAVTMDPYVYEMLLYLVQEAVDAYERGEEIVISEGVHGKWVPESSRPKAQIFTCSYCGSKAYYPQNNRRSGEPKKIPYKHCPSCLAKMDGVDLSEAADTWRKVFDADDDVPVTIVYKDEEGEE